MSDPLTDTPPAAPPIPVGLATFVGLGTGAGQWLAAILAAVDGDHSATTIALIVTGAATVITTLVGRYAQAHAAIRSGGLPTALIANELNTSTPTGLSAAELAIGQTDPDANLTPTDPATVPPDEGDAQAAAAPAPTPEVQS